MDVYSEMTGMYHDPGDTFEEYDRPAHNPGNCECEHNEHFDNTRRLYPEAHAYNETPAEHSVQTPYGGFNLCRVCFGQGHMQEVQR